MLLMLANQSYCNSAPHASKPILLQLSSSVLMLANQYYYNSAPHASKPILLQLCSSCWQTNSESICFFSAVASVQCSLHTQETISRFFQTTLVKWGSFQASLVQVDSWVFVLSLTATNGCQMWMQPERYYHEYLGQRPHCFQANGAFIHAVPRALTSRRWEQRPDPEGKMPLGVGERCKKSTDLAEPQKGCRR